MQSFIFSLENIDETAAKILESIADARIIAIYGDMGAGKTTLIKALCRAAGVRETVTSPTFALVNEYFSPEKGTTYHFDFYRITDPSEVYDIGYEEYFYGGALCLLEWPELIEDLLPDDTLRFYLDVTDDGKRRLSIARPIDESE
jgi:tRNA threonylcarbamoyladenosine biosynthesis protein TsaE